jgi:pimeloyl-ACP methyl ester carboxylesterase
MTVLKRDDAEIYFEEFGSGYPVLLFAPGGLRSRIEMWHAPAEGPARPWNDWTEELESRYRVIAMDQRNAGRSRGAIASDHGWHTYAADHLALMDHLGFKRFHTLGGCIGSSYCLKLCEIAPERVSCAVLQNPIHAACISDSGNQAVGRSRGGLTTKLHVVVDGKGLPLRLGITAGQAHDNRLCSTLLSGLRLQVPPHCRS